MRLAPFTYSPIHLFTVLLYNPQNHADSGGNMRNRLVVLAVCLVLLAGARRLRSQVPAGAQTDLPFNKLVLSCAGTAWMPPCSTAAAKQAEESRCSSPRLAVVWALFRITDGLRTSPRWTGSTRGAIPALDYLLTYDVVIVHNNYHYADDAARRRAGRLRGSEPTWHGMNRRMPAAG